MKRGRKPFDAKPGDRFNMLTLVEILPDVHPTSGNRMWRLRCDCGHVIDRAGQNVRYGHVKSCGCLAVAQNRLRTAAGVALAAQQLLRQQQSVQLGG